MRQLAITILLLCGLSALTWYAYPKVVRKVTLQQEHAAIRRPPVINKEKSILHARAVLAKQFVLQKGFNQQFCFLLDMRLPANRKRFFVFDMERDSILNSGLVAHGNCNQYWLEGKKYSNNVGCGCTSLGRYKIGYSYYGRFGLAFKLYGLDKSNSNAFDRYVVLHAHSCMPAHETADEVCQSNGCPMVSPSFLKQLEPIIKASKQPVLLWIFDDEK